MLNYVQDSGGINSLSGFSYQIRVFVYYMMKLGEGVQIEFETLDDVTIRNLKPEDIDKYEEEFRYKLTKDGVNTAIQVKRTKISQSTFLQVLLNWILLEASNSNIEEFILFTDDKYDNRDSMFNKSELEYFEEINKSDKKANATITKVKILCNNDYDFFKKIFLSIKGKYNFISLCNLDQEIVKGFSIHFRKYTANNVVYHQRINELIKCVTVEVLDSINKNRPYIHSFEKFMKLVEDITNRMTEKITLPSYVDFKRLHKVDLDDLNIIESREYNQLELCELPEHLIKQYLIECKYYENVRYKYMENNKTRRIKYIEETKYEAYLSTKYDLQFEEKDTPYRRLKETNKNSMFEEGRQISNGSGIYLTKDGIKEKQISWKDEDDET